MQTLVTLDFVDGSIGDMDATFVCITQETNPYTSHSVTGVQSFVGLHT